MASALRTMYVPQFVMEKVSSELSSQGMSAEERGLIGQTETMDKFILTLGPIIIEAGPVAIILTLAIVGTVAMAKYVDEAHRKRCEEERRWAQEHCEELLESPNPSRHQTGGYRNVKDCMKGFISKDCPDGNPVDYGDQPTRPGRKT